jgi:phosphinothricin acetyltransferase
VRLRQQTRAVDAPTAVIAAGTADDLGRINEIYNHYVVRSPATFDLEPRSMAWRREWFARYTEHGRHRVLVARGAEGAIAYATSSPYRPRAAYEPTVETSVYVAPEHLGRGIGLALYETLLRELEAQDVHRAIAGITLPNPASVRLHARCGFREVGRFSEQGRKFGSYWDVAWYERAMGTTLA